MSTFDPTSAVHLPPATRRWTIQEVANLQHDVQRTAQRARNGTRAEATPPAPALAPSRTGDETAAETQSISGCYRATGGASDLELRIDVDGLRPTQRVSGDFFRRSGATLGYVGSFIVERPSVTVTDGEARLEGAGTFSFQSGSPWVRITVPLTNPLASRAAAAVQFLTMTGQPGSVYTCPYVSPYFRTIELEIDYVDQVTPFDRYDTGKLESGGPQRVLTVPGAFAEAGIEMTVTGAGNGVPAELAGTDAIWTDRELHAAMREHFSRWNTDPAWRVWLFAATRHELGEGLRGIMFDSVRRQGCAVFHDVVGGTTDRVVRAMLRTYVHELGHCFNLFHSHHKEFMSPPLPNRLDALSWMHYPAYFQSGTAAGEAAYWRAFPFQFDDDEIAHLRHGFRGAVIPGGQKFGVGAADLNLGMFADPIADESGLRLELRAPNHFLLGTPVVVEIKLSLTDLRGRTVNTALHPSKGYVQIAIARDGGTPRLFRPLIAHCAEPSLVRLDEARPASYDSAYIGYGKDGLYFASPGRYTVRAVYSAPDGSSVVSNQLALDVKPPITRVDSEVADAFLGDDQGRLLSLLGSDEETLRGGRDQLALVRDKYPDHPMTTYACLVGGMNASRPFKRVRDHHVTTRAANQPEAMALLGKVVQSTTQPNTRAETAETSAPVPRLDNISLQMAMSRLAQVHLEAGDERGADRSVATMYEFFVTQEKVPAFVAKDIRTSIRDTLGERAEEGIARRRDSATAR